MAFEDDFNQIKNLLSERKLNWLIEQVQEQIETGKLVVEKQTTLKEIYQDRSMEPIFEAIEYRSGPPADYTVREDYTPKEKVELILKALQRATVDPVFMERDLNQLLEDKISLVSFTNPNEDEELRSTEIKLTRDQEIENKAEELNRIIHQMLEKSEE